MFSKQENPSYGDSIARASVTSEEREIERLFEFVSEAKTRQS
jgi:hypothetical protein